LSVLERVGDEAFEADRLRRPGRVAVAFLADWCPFCRAFLPAFERLAQGRSSMFVVADVTSQVFPVDPATGAVTITRIAVR
jgi:thiol-disulfide isomerase/thioredoxin